MLFASLVVGFSCLSFELSFSLHIVHLEFKCIEHLVSFSLALSIVCESFEFFVLKAISLGLDFPTLLDDGFAGSSELLLIVLKGFSFDSVFGIDSEFFWNFVSDVLARGENDL